MDPFAHVRFSVVTALESLKTAGEIDPAAVFDNVAVEPPREAAYGCMATNAALVVARWARATPRALAETLASSLRGDPDLQEVSVAGSGFVNFRLKDAYWARIVPAVLHAGADFGRLDAGAGEKVLVEYVSANPTGRLHVGHVRGAVYGDVIANLLEFAGHDVEREYYVNDAGHQMTLFARSVDLRFRELGGEPVETIPDGHYPGEDPRLIAQALRDSGEGEAVGSESAHQRLDRIRAFAAARMMSEIRADLERVGIRHGRFVSERSDMCDSGKLTATIDELRARGLIYSGTLPPPRGREPPREPAQPMQLFRLSSLATTGDLPDQVVVRANEQPTYFAADVAYHLDKYRRGYRWCIDVWGAEHAGHIPRIKAAMDALTDGEMRLSILVCQTVRVLRDGHVQTMSKRLGNTVGLREHVQEVGSDPVRFFMVMRSNTAPLDFDLSHVVAHSRKNPVFYVQYAYARICSVLRHAANQFEPHEFTLSALRDADMALLRHPLEIALMRSIGQFPRVIEQSVRELEPHRVAYYLSENLAHAVHTLWNRGNAEPELRFLSSERPAHSLSRLALLSAARTVLDIGLTLLGVSRPETMT